LNSGFFAKRTTFSGIDFCGQFLQQFTSSFYTDILPPKNYKAKVKMYKNFTKTFIQKSCSLNVGEIDPWRKRIGEEWKRDLDKILARQSFSFFSPRKKKPFPKSC